MRRKIGNVNWLQLQTENDFKVFNSMMEEERMVDIILTVIATISMIVGLLGIFAVIRNRRDEVYVAGSRKEARDILYKGGSGVYRIS